jgi:hypothetical protein
MFAQVSFESVLSKGVNEVVHAICANIRVNTLAGLTGLGEFIRGDALTRRRLMRLHQTLQNAPSRTPTRQVYGFTVGKRE